MADQAELLERLEVAVDRAEVGRQPPVEPAAILRAERAVGAVERLEHEAPGGGDAQPARAGPRWRRRVSGPRTGGPAGETVTAA